MHFGTYMGIYWILKFILFPLGFHIPFLSLLFVILTLSVPFIGYHYAKMYRDKICGGSIQFSPCHALYHIYVYVCFSAGSCGSLRLFPIHRSWIYHQLLHPVVGRTDDQHPGSDRNKEVIKETIDTAPFTYFHQYHHATIVMGCILGKYPGHSHRIDGNEKGQTGK